jgi:carbamoylphosphate synthase large subunit
LKDEVAAPVYKTENTAVGIRHADHVASSICESSLTGGGRSVGIVRSRAKVLEFLHSMHKLIDVIEFLVQSSFRNRIEFYYNLIVILYIKYEKEKR